MPLKVPLAAGEVLGSMIEKPSLPGAPLRNRTVDLLLTMNPVWFLSPRWGGLTRKNTSPREHSQALIRLSRARFATQSDTHFDLEMLQEPGRAKHRGARVRTDQHRMLVHGTDMHWRALP